jgi:lipopolysaccharide/colanic/teichoic acid biosynthesis glycosyltransferase
MGLWSDKNIKLAIDIAGALTGVILIMPLVPLIALAIKIDGRGPVFVKLKRISGGEEFNLYKFRTMIDGANSLKARLSHLNERRDGPYFKIKNDPRVTRIGRFLRRFRLDEFPQLINVLRGEMSLVGPRPYEPEEIAAYPEQYRHLYLAKGGVTGLSQISGSSSLSFQKTLELDDYYLKNRNVWLDIKIIGKTLAIILTDHNAV